MPPVTRLDTQLETEEMLLAELEHAWQAIGYAYDVMAEMPTVHILFADVDFMDPVKAAQVVLANMLSEAIEYIDRFSPWYTQPASAFGLKSARNPFTRQVRWVLTAAAIQQWHEELERLAIAIQDNTGLIQGILLVDGLMTEAEPDPNRVTAKCGCTPPVTIRVDCMVLNRANIVCHTCRQPFRTVNDEG